MSSDATTVLHEKREWADESVHSPCSGKRGIRTPGPVKVNGFQDRRDRPLRHLSEAHCWSFPKRRDKGSASRAKNQKKRRIFLGLPRRRLPKTIQTMVKGSASRAKNQKKRRIFLGLPRRRLPKSIMTMVKGSASRAKNLETYMVAETNEKIEGICVIKRLWNVKMV